MGGSEALLLYTDQLPSSIEMCVKEERRRMPPEKPIQPSARQFVTFRPHCERADNTPIATAAAAAASFVSFW